MGVFFQFTPNRIFDQVLIHQRSIKPSKTHRLKALSKPLNYFKVIEP